MRRFRINRKNWWVAGLLLAGLLVTVFFGLQVLHSFNHLRSARRGPPPAEYELIREWMTIEFISSHYRVTEAELFSALNIPAEGNNRKSLAELNEAYYPDEPGRVVEIVQGMLRPPGPPVSPGNKQP